MTELLITAVGGVLGALGYRAWRWSRRNTRQLRAMETVAASLPRTPTPMRVTVVYRPSERAYMVVVTNPAAASSSGTGHPLPTRPNEYGPYRTQRRAEAQAALERERYNRLELPDVTV